MRVAVIGSGISGLGAAWVLSKSHEVVVYEAQSRPGGHSHTVDIDYLGRPLSVDTGFIVYNDLNYPNLVNLFKALDVPTEASDMSFSVSVDNGRLEWAGDTLDTFFAQRRNLTSPGFLRMGLEILRCNREAAADFHAGKMAGLSLGDYLNRGGYSARFRDHYLFPMGAAIWSADHASMFDFPAESFTSFFENHCLLKGFDGRPQWRTVTGGSRSYVNRITALLGRRLRLDTPVTQISRGPAGVMITDGAGQTDRFDHVIMAVHGDQILPLLADPSPEERRLLTPVRFSQNEVILHRDPSLMPKRRKVWSSWNYVMGQRQEGAQQVLSYWMNRLQNLDPQLPLFVSLNPKIQPREDLVFRRFSYDHPLYDASMAVAQKGLPQLQGVNRTWFAGAWTAYGFHEDGLRSGLSVAEALGGAVPWTGKGQRFAQAAE